MADFRNSFLRNYINSNCEGSGLAWNTLNDTFIKVVLVFICLAAVISTKTRLDALILLSVSIGAKLGYDAFNMFQAGEFNVEGYRVKVGLGGMFGNPNDLAIHFVIFLRSRSRVHYLPGLRFPGFSGLLPLCLW